MKGLDDYTISILRQRRGLDESDNSLDHELLKMSSKEIVKEMIIWEYGHSSVYHSIISIFSCAIGIEEEEVENKLFNE